MIKVRTLGGLEVADSQGRELRSVVAQPKRLALLAYLAAHNHHGSRRRDSLVAVFWPELDAEHARGALRQSLTFLRRALGEGVLDGGTGEDVGFEPAALECDATAFEQACDDGRLADALELYRGDFLEGFFVSGISPDLERWMESERARLRRRAARVAAELAVLAEREGDPASAVQAARWAVALDPDDEGALARLITLLDRGGDRSGAVRAYEEFVRRLAADHEVAPSPETQALIRAVRSRVAENLLQPDFGALQLESSRAAVPTLSGDASAARRKRSLRRFRTAILVSAVAGAVALAVVTRRGARAAVQPEVVAVLPFRVTGASLELRYLREGIIDLLATKLTGDGGPRALSPRTVMRAWRTAVSSDDQDLPEVAALALTRRLGAGQLLQGAIVGTRRQLVLEASLLDVTSGNVRARANVTGPSDSLPVLIDHLAAQLLVREAGETESRIATLTSTSLPALRAYLGGQADYRRGEYTSAVQQFHAELELDSTFALANLGLALAEVWVTGPSPLTVAYTNRARLTWRDRALLAALLGPEYPKPSPIVNARAAWERAVRALPDRPEAWDWLGELYFHEGSALRLEAPQRWAAQALERALALDSTFPAPLVHRIDLAAIAGDTALVHRLGLRYARLDSAGDLAPYVRWRVATSLGDTRILARLRASMNQMPVVSLWEIENIGQLDAVGLDDVERAAAVLHERRGDGSARCLSLTYLYNLALNRGRPKAALAVLAALDVAAPAGHAASRSLVLNGLFGDGDSSVAAQAARQLGRQALSPLDQDPDTRDGQLDILCVAELWRVSHRDFSSVYRTIDRLQLGVPARGSSSGVPFQRLCAAMLRAIQATVAVPGDADAAGDVLDSLLQGVPTSAPSIVVAAALTLARLRESRGDFAAALNAVRRRGYGRVGGGGPYFLATCFREEGRLAALIGDRAAAIRSYRKYLALRSRPEAALQQDVDRVRADLAALDSSVTR